MREEEREERGKPLLPFMLAVCLFILGGWRKPLSPLSLLSLERKKTHIARKEERNLPTHGKDEKRTQQKNKTSLINRTHE